MDPNATAVLEPSQLWTVDTTPARVKRRGDTVRLPRQPQGLAEPCPVVLVDPAHPELGTYPGLDSWRQLEPSARVAYARSLALAN